MKIFACSNRFPQTFIAAIVFLAVGEAAHASDKVTYEIVATFGLGPCGPTTQQVLSATSINNNGEVVGYFYPCVFELVSKRSRREVTILRADSASQMCSLFSCS